MIILANIFVGGACHAQYHLVGYCCRREQLLSSARGTQQHNSRQVADQREAASLQRYNCGCIEGLDQTGNSCSNKACHTNSEFPDLY